MRPARQKTERNAAIQLVGGASLGGLAETRTDTRPETPTETPLEAERRFVEAYDRLYGRLRDYAARFLDRDAAEDAVGEAMSDLWTRWARLTPEQRTDQYIFGVVHHVVVDTLKAQAPRVSLADAEEEIDAQTMAATEQPTRVDTAADVLDLALAVMPRQRREVLRRIHEERRSYKDVAVALGLSVGTINTHYRLAMEDLRRAFTRAGFRIDDLKSARLLTSKVAAFPDGPVPRLRAS